MSNTTGTLTGDLNVKFGPAREAWLRVPFGARLVWGVANTVLFVAGLVISGFLSWTGAVMVFDLAAFQGIELGPIAEAIARWSAAFLVGSSVFSAGVYCSASVLDEWVERTYLLLTKRFN